MEPLALRPARQIRWLTWPLFCVCLAFAWCRPALAVDQYYINNSILSYPGTVSYPPQIDALNFINNSDFTINFTTLTVDNEFYTTTDTINYTNNGSMVVNTGFQFDTLDSSTGFHTRAGNFDNPGFVSCGSFINDPGANLFIGFGQCLVNATNIQVHSGGSQGIDVGPEGLIQLTGQNVDLSQSLLTIESGGANLGGTAVAGLNTNFWDPSAFLGPNFAESAFFPIAPFFLLLTNSVPYFDQRTVNGTNVIRAVFLQDTSGSNVTTSVYFDPAIIDFPGGFGRGFVTIQWAGSYLDSASGNTYSNYLYLNDDYFLGASTNVAIIGGVPDNFTITESPTPVPLQGLTPPGFLNVFFPGTVTNLYDFANLQLLASVSTNAVANSSITNLPGRVEISGDDYLNLSNAQITGQSYMSLTSTNNFAGSQGALIQTPYSDLNLGQRNGVLYITNTMQAQIPFWGGNIQAWNTRWIYVDTTLGVTNDYRILIVGSQLTTTIAAMVQNLMLRDYSSNNIVISDTFNVMNSFYADAQSLTTTTNPIGNGATSFDGEVNLESPAIFFQSSLPNLRYLTNNGAIRMQNLAYFCYPTLTNVVGGVTNVVPFLTNTAFINNGIFMDEGSVIYAGNFESGGIISNGVGQFTLQSLTTTLTNGSLYAGADVSMTASSLIASNLALEADRSLTLQATNILTDTGPSPTNNNTWAVALNSVGNGISLPIKPTVGDLLGTTLTLYGPTNRTVYNYWAGHDYGLTTAGYTNNEAVGRLRFDVATPVIAGHNAKMVFNAPGVSNALYVDLLVLTNFATSGNATNNFNFPWLQINNNMFVYFARAIETFSNGLVSDVSEAIDDQSKLGANNGRLRWIYSYTGYYSSTNVYYTNSLGVVTTNTVNAGLAQSKTIDSDSDGIPNYYDPTPFFVAPEVNFTAATATNGGHKVVKIQWTTIPNATNYVYYSTNLLTPVTNWFYFNNSFYGNNVMNTNRPFTNSVFGLGFVSPQTYITNAALPDNSQQTNVWLYDSITNVPHYYKVVVWPSLNNPE